MDRANCMMCEVHMGEIYCGYYDAFCRLCSEVEDCPEEEAYETEYNDGEDEDEDNFKTE